MSILLEQLESRARLTPGAIAIRSASAALSFARLWADVNAVAHKLRSRQVSSLGIYLDNGIEWIVVDLAAIAAGVRVVPLPWFFSERQIRHALVSGAVDGVVFADELPVGISSAGSTAELYREARLQPISPRSKAAAGATRPGGKMSFTSGSTGNPRGVLLEQDFIERSCQAIAAAIPHSDIDCHLSLLPYSTLLENLAGMYVPLMLGKTVHAETAECIGLSARLGIDPARLRVLFNRVQPASLILTPRLLELLCALAAAQAIDPGCLRFVAVGGARAGETLIQSARAAGIPAYEGYGLTEFGSVAILNTPADDRVGSVGKPLPGVTVTLAKDGEICLATLVGGEAPGSSARAVRVPTGDYGAIDADGFVYVHGRKSSLIVLPNGRNVSPEWIEAELDSSPLIAQSCVYASADGELSALLMPACVDFDATRIDAEIARINADLPPYARIQAWCRLRRPFSYANRMLTANGRLRRRQIDRELPELLAEARQTEPPKLIADVNRHAFQEINP